MPVQSRASHSRCDLEKLAIHPLRNISRFRIEPQIEPRELQECPVSEQCLFLATPENSAAIQCFAVENALATL